MSKTTTAELLRQLLAVCESTEEAKEHLTALSEAAAGPPASPDAKDGQRPVYYWEACQIELGEGEMLNYEIDKHQDGHYSTVGFAYTAEDAKAFVACLNHDQELRAAAAEALALLEEWPNYAGPYQGAEERPAWSTIHRLRGALGL